MWVLIIVHLASFIMNIFVELDIRYNGVPDVNGVYTSKKATMVSTIETIIQCMVFGVCIKHLLD